MKILNSAQIRQVDAFTIEHEPISSIDLMERAASKCFDWITAKIDKGRKIKVVCGLGNNGGDGLVIARLLITAGYKIEVFIIRHAEKTSADFKVNEERLRKLKRKKIIIDVKSISDLPAFHDGDVIIDAIFGSGLSKPVDGLLAEVIEHINKCKGYVIAVDLPSGLFSEDNTSNNHKAIVNADITLTFQLPKLAFLLPGNYEYVGEWWVLDIGLNTEFIDSFDSPYYFIEEDDARQMLKQRGKFTHKGNFGHALLISGSYGKMGATVLASEAALRAGAGLVTAHIPRIGYNIIQTAVPEAMVSLNATEEFISSVPDISKYNAIAIGPGIDTKGETQKALKLLIQTSSIPIIFDADALNILAENKTWLSFVPKHSILTPHPKEFERLAGKPANDNERLLMQMEFSVKFGVYVIYKGAYTTISAPDGKFFFNSTGNPGMATGGSGDVHTGILLGLKACGYSSLETAILGAYLHGRAGDMAKEQLGEEALIARDIIDNLGEAFLSLRYIE
ncbi:MAG: NAD(P)H-hydrate dehydratase [Bacteroidales bacterium]